MLKKCVLLMEILVSSRHIFKDLLMHYITLPVVLTFLGGIAGSVVGFSKYGAEYQTMDSYNYYSLPWLDTVISPYLIVYGVIMPPFVAMVVNLLVVRCSLSRTALSLIRNEQKACQDNSSRGIEE